MERVTYPSVEVQAALKARYLRRTVDIGTDPDTARLFGVAVVPMALVLDGNGKVLDSREGSSAPAEFAAWLRARR
ncbi:MAG: hypothetical protein IT463_00195 [Planctomycetes bacterium]|nr:hypothetical protein [Planctomycetota bacterium]